MKTVFQKLLPELKPYTGRLIFVVLLGVVISGLKALTPELSRQLERSWQEGAVTLSILIPLGIALVWTLAGVARYFHLFWMKYISDLVSVNLRRQLMSKYLSLNLSFFQGFERGSGGLISRMLNDIKIIQGGIYKLADVVREPFLALFAFGYLVYIDWKLTFFIVVTVPLITSVLRNLARSLRKYGHKNQETMEDLTRTLKESLDGSRIVQSFNLEDEMRERFNREADRYLATRKKIISRQEAAGPATEALASMAFALILIYIGQQIFATHLTIGDFIGFTFAIGLMQDSIRKLQKGYIKLQQAAVALDRLYGILDSTSVMPQPQNPASFPRQWQNIEYKNVSFSFESERVLKNINLNVEKGEIIALVGSSGSGKSTLVNLLERFFDPVEGEIRIGDVPLNSIDLKDLRSHIALVSQDTFLFNDTVARNIQAGDFSKNHEQVLQASKRANAHTFIENLKNGYNTMVGEGGSTLSGGEKQRISIARALLKDAPILILDEATSALDSESELEVQKGLDHLLTGRTAFVIAHRLSTISKADRIVVLKEGEIVEQGSHRDLLDRQGEYYKFHQLQATL